MQTMNSNCDSILNYTHDGIVRSILDSSSESNPGTSEDDKNPPGSYDSQIFCRNTHIPSELCTEKYFFQKRILNKRLVQHVYKQNQTLR